MLPFRRFLLSSATLFGANALLANESQGFAIDATVSTGLGSLSVKDSTTSSNNRSNISLYDSTSPLVNSSTSPKLCVQADGSLSWSPHNFQINSQAFDNAAWAPTRAVVDADATTAPDGTTTADRLKDNSAGGTGTVFIGETCTFSSAGTKTFSVRAKADGLSWLFIQGVNFTSPATGGIYYNIGAGVGAVGTADAGYTGAIEDLGDGWWLCKLTFDLTTDLVGAFRLYPADGDLDNNVDLDGTSSIFVWGAQANNGDTPVTYLPTTSAAVFGVPLDYDLTNSLWSILSEPAATNLCLQSNDFTTTWTNTNTDEPTTNNTAPNGTATADEIAATATADQAFAIYQGFTGLTANNQAVCSVFAKLGTNATMIQLAWDADGTGADGCFCNFNLSTGVKGTVTALAAGTATAAYIEEYGDYYRCTIVGKIATGTVGRFTISIVDEITATVFQAANLADNDSVILWGAQVEAAASNGSVVPSSMIPTRATTVTRATDAIAIATTAFPFSVSGGSLIAVVRKYVTANTTFATLADVDGHNLISLFQLASNSWRLRANYEQVQQVNIITTITDTDDYHGIGGAFASDDFELAIDGVSIGTNVTDTTYPDITTTPSLHVASGRHGAGSTSSGAARLTSLVYVPRRMSATELVARTVA